MLNRIADDRKDPSTNFSDKDIHSGEKICGVHDVLQEKGTTMGISGTKKVEQRAL
jgi:hypothetical protein